MSEEANESFEYRVVVNDEGQHSIWPSERSVPIGWRAISDALPKPDALRFIAERWSDITPLSVQRARTPAA
jgi:MbtH protein